MLSSSTCLVMEEVILEVEEAGHLMELPDHLMEEVVAGHLIMGEVV